MLPVFRHPVHQGQFIVFEPNGMRTYIRDSDSYGLVIEQRLPTGKKRRIRYGNDQAGYELYIEILRYLAGTKQKIPGFHFTPGRESTHLKSAIESKMDLANRATEPLPHQMDMDSHGVIAPVQLNSGLKGLAISQDGRPAVFLSNELIHAIAKTIPRIFGKNPYFHQIHSFYSHQGNRPKIGKIVFHSVPSNEERNWTLQRWKGKKTTARRIMSIHARKLNHRRKPAH